MKTYKIKSLAYLSCFVAAAIYYYHFEQSQSQQPINGDEYVEMDAQDLSDLNADERELLEEGDLD